MQIQRRQEDTNKGNPNKHCYSFLWFVCFVPLGLTIRLSRNYLLKIVVVTVFPRKIARVIISYFASKRGDYSRLIELGSYFKYDLLKVVLNALFQYTIYL